MFLQMRSIQCETMNTYNCNVGCIILLTFALWNLCDGIQLTAFISQSLLHGEVIFRTTESGVTVLTSLQTAEDDTQWSWSVRVLPVLYSSLQDRCGDQQLGHTVVNLDDLFGPLTLPANGSSEVTTSLENLTLTGSRGVWGKSLLLQSPDGYRRACGTITVSGEADEKVAEARFFSPISGSVFFRWVGSHHSDSTDTLIHTNLRHVNDPTANKTKHLWKIYTTDILDTEADKARENCNFLQLVFDPVASQEATKQVAVGDLSARLGQVEVAEYKSTPTMPSVFHDAGLTALSVDLLQARRSLYVVIFDPHHDDYFLTCAKVRQLHPVKVKALVQQDGVKGEVTMTQRSPFDPTRMHFNLTSSLDDLVGGPRTNIAGYKIHELPPSTQPGVEHENRCLTTGRIYNPSSISEDSGSSSQDTYAVGDLSGKHNMWRKPQNLVQLREPVWDAFLPLFGQLSVAHRAVVLYRENETLVTNGQETLPQIPWLCGTLAQYDPKDWKVSMFTASAVYRYPVVGRIVLRQPRDEPLADTSVLIEYLVHGDGTSNNNTAEHRWTVNEFPPGRDFYNWSGRCLSAGPIFNPYNVYADQESDSPCTASCRVGELNARHGTLDVAGRKVNGAVISRHLYTDTLLPLSGPGSVLGRSLVLYDDHGPKARGERLACSIIGGEYRRKAVAKDWFGNGETTPVTGHIEFLQQTEYDVTDVDVDLQGLELNGGYHVHMTPIEANLEFPCEGSSLYGHWNPRGVSPSRSPQPGVGTTDQYEMGDLAGKFGALDNLTSLLAAYNDTDLPLFGPLSVLGRSIVIHKKEKNARWACSTIERGYAPSEARELRAIASFHHPLGFAYGYIRMTQLVYNDKSKSDTVIEVNVRHPGKHDRNVTRNHNWAIYVNPVGVDATVQVLDTRCVAGGYLWNPYYTQLADPLNDELYRAECGSDNPLRCYVGDLSGRLGTIDVGDKRQVFTDVNFPLEGTVSAIGRSIVILNKDRRGERFACANIQPDNDIIKYANIRKPPRFVVAQFIQDVREVMGLPEWMLSVDSRKTKTLHGETCIQFLLHFKGPEAIKLDQDFSKLMSTGHLAAPSLYIPGYVPSSKRKTQLSYRPCGSRDPNEKNTRTYSTFGVKNENSGCHQPILVPIIYLAAIPFVVLFR